MDPLSVGLGLAGFGMRLFGGMGASEEAKKQAELSKQNFKYNQQLQENRHKAMLLASRRQQLEILRNSQRARAMGLNAAVSQGAQFGSGIQGGYGQVAGQTNTNLLGNFQSLELGQESYGLNRKISANNMLISESQSRMSQDQGIMSLGGSLLQSAPTIGKLFGGFGI